MYHFWKSFAVDLAAVAQILVAINRQIDQAAEIDVDDGGRSAGDVDRPADLKAEDALIWEVIGHLLAEVVRDQLSEIIVHPIEEEVVNIGQNAIVATQTEKSALLIEVVQILVVTMQQTDLLGKFQNKSNRFLTEFCLSRRPHRSPSRSPSRSPPPASNRLHRRNFDRSVSPSRRFDINNALHNLRISDSSE